MPFLYLHKAQLEINDDEPRRFKECSVTAGLGRGNHLSMEHLETLRRMYRKLHGFSLYVQRHVSRVYEVNKTL